MQTNSDQQQTDKPSAQENLKEVTKALNQIRVQEAEGRAREKDSKEAKDMVMVDDDDEALNTETTRDEDDTEGEFILPKIRMNGTQPEKKKLGRPPKNKSN